MRRKYIPSHSIRTLISHLDNERKGIPAANFWLDKWQNPE